MNTTADMQCSAGTAAETAELLSTSPTAGLTRREARKRLRYFGQNKIYDVAAPDKAGAVIRLLLSPGSLLFVCAAATAAVCRVKGVFACCAIYAAVMLLLSFLRVGAGRVSYAVGCCGIPRQKVIREGTTRLTDSRALVPGDLVLLSDGDVVCADCRVIFTDGMRVQETTDGDEYRICEKTAEPCSTAMAPTEMTNTVFANSTVVRGGCRAIVVATGSDTVLLSGRGGAPVPLPGKRESVFYEKACRRAGLRGAITSCLLLLVGAALLFARPVGETFYFFTSVACAVFFLCGAERIAVSVAYATVTSSLAAKQGMRAIIKNAGALDALSECDAIIFGETFAEPCVATLEKRFAEYGVRVYITAETGTAAALAKQAGATLANTAQQAVLAPGSAPVVAVCRTPSERAELATLLSRAGKTVAAVASKPGHVGLLSAAQASFCCAALRLEFRKLTDITLEDIDRSAGNEAMMKNSDILCDPVPDACISALSAARSLVRRVQCSEKLAYISGTALLLLLCSTFAGNTSLITPLGAVLCAFLPLLSGILVRSGFVGESRARITGTPRLAGYAGYSCVWLIALFAVRIFSGLLGFTMDDCFSGYATLSAMLYISATALFAAPERTRGFGFFRRVLPLLIVLPVITALLLLPGFAAAAAPGASPAVLALSAVPALLASGLCALNHVIYNKFK